MKMDKDHFSKIGEEARQWFVENFPDGASHKKVISLLVKQKTTHDWIKTILVNFKLSGEFKQWHKNGKVKIIANYLKGIRYGLVNEYFETGKVSNAYECGNDGRLSGRWQDFYLNGAPKSFYKYEGGIPHGEYKELDRCGNLITEGYFKDGEKDGIWKICYEGFVETGRYISDEKHGEWVEREVCSGIASGKYVHGKMTGRWEIIYPDIPHIELDCFECKKSKSQEVL